MTLFWSFCWANFTTYHHLLSYDISWVMSDHRNPRCSQDVDIFLIEFKFFLLFAIFSSSRQDLWFDSTAQYAMIANLFIYLWCVPFVGMLILSDLLKTRKKILQLYVKPEPAQLCRKTHIIEWWHTQWIHCYHHAFNIPLLDIGLCLEKWMLSIWVGIIIKIINIKLF